jgi:cysteine desulfurase
MGERSLVTRVYLDNSSAAEPFLEAVSKMLPFFQHKWHSTNSIHRPAGELSIATQASLDAIDRIFVLGDNDRFFLSSSGAESISSLFLSHYFDIVKETGRNHFLFSNQEDAPIIKSLKRLESFGCVSKALEVDECGQITLESVERNVRPRTSMLSLSWANGLTGVIQPIEEIGAFCREKEIFFHVDATYVLGKTSFRFKELPVDYMTFDGEKLHAPKGCAGLIVKEGAPYSPLIVGNPSLNVPALVGLSTALEIGAHYLDHLCMEIARLRDYLEERILQMIPDSIVFFKEGRRLPHCSAIGFPGVVAEALLYDLNEKGIFASLGGTHCQKLFNILKNCKVDPLIAQSAISFSLSYKTTEEEIDIAVNALEISVKRLRTLSSQFFRY